MQAIETIYYQDDSDPLGPDWEAIEALELSDRLALFIILSGLVGYDDKNGALDG